MTRLLFLFLLYLISFNTHSESAKMDLAAIETDERQRIIAELSWRLDAKQNCNTELNWNDGGSGADKDGYFFLPKVQGSEYIIGGYVADKLRSDYHCVMTVREVSDNPKGTPPLLAKPADWKMVWKDSGSGARADGSFWQAIPSDSNYVCIGHVSQSGYSKPNIPAYRCIHSTLTEKINAKLLSWTDKGSGADKPVSVFRLPQTISFVAIPERTANASVFDLVKDAKRVPDNEQVDKILAQRMAPLKADIEAKGKQKQEQEAAEQKRLAEEAAKKKAQAEKLAVEKAEKQRLAEEEKQKQMATAAKVEQPIAQPKIEEPIKKETEQTPIKMPVKAKAEAEVEEPVIEETVSEKIIEKTVAPEPVVTQKDSKSDKPSKGLDHLVNTFLKILAILFVGLIILLFAFKFLFGGKKEK